MGAWSRKSIAETAAEAAAGSDASGLARALGARDLVVLGVGAVVGAGIFVVVGPAAAEYAGPGVALSFLVAAGACLLSGLCYAELAAMMPAAGSAYVYTYASLGELVAWIVGWNLVLEYLVACGLVAAGWSGYFTHFMSEFGVSLPGSWTNPSLTAVAGQGLQGSGAVVNLPAVAIVALMAWILCLGIRRSARFGTAIVIIKVGVVLLFVVFGLAHATPQHWTPFIPENRGAFGRFGWSGVLRGAAVVFVSYLGFDAVSTAAQETRNPQRATPIGILGSLGIATTLYVLMSLAMTGLAPYQALGVSNPVDVALANAGATLAWLKPLVSVATIVGLASVILMQLFGQSRVFFAMSRDGLLPRPLAAVNRERHAPVKATIAAASFAALIGGILPVSMLSELVAIGTLTAFSAVCASVIVLRRTMPEAPRPFRVWGVPLVPFLGIAWCVTMMASLPAITWLAFLGWLVAGIGLYLAYGRRHSRFADRRLSPPAQLRLGSDVSVESRR